MAAQPARAGTPPSLHQRVGRVLLGLALLWVVVVGTVLWAWMRHEVQELLDDSLHATAEALTMAVAEAGTLPSSPAKLDGVGTPFVWQVLDREGRVLARSREAPQAPLAAPGVGFLDGQFGWRVFGNALPGERWLLAGQLGRERLEAVLEAAAGMIASTLLVALVGLYWLRWRLRVHTQPLAELASDLARYDPLRPGARLPPPQLAELVPVHEAVHSLGQRLAVHVAAEAAFNAHAAHALRTPLAGLEAQIAVAQREAPPPLHARLARMREGTARLSRVVGALLALFRSGGELQRAALDVRSLVARVPIAGLTVQVRGMEELHADPDLLSAALINLLDNSLRHGAGTVWIEVQRDALVVRDDGPGVLPARLQALRAALAGASVGAGVGAGAAGDAAAAPVAGAGAAQTPADAGAGSAGAGLGLGLLLAERAARAHGGWLELLESERGFAVRLVLAPAADGPRAMAA